jgi:acetyl esterase/lipase
VITNRILIAALLIQTVCIAQSLPPSVPLWPNGAPGSEGLTSPEILSSRVEPTTPTVDGLTMQTVSNVNNPSITPFLPLGFRSTGAAVVIAPGGGHQFLAIEHEGYAVARVLADRGIAAFVLKYRLAKEANSPYKVEVHALMDAQRAIRLVRSDAGKWGVDPHRVGIMGFSAGGELAMLAATRYDKPVAGSSDSVDQLNCRPDFVALLYPGGDPSGAAIPKDMPPAFLACAYNDKPATSENLAKLYMHLKETGVPAEFHIYNSGGHGFGVRPDSERPVAHWTDLFVDWLGDRGITSNK